MSFVFGALFQGAASFFLSSGSSSYTSSGKPSGTVKITEVTLPCLSETGALEDVIWIIMGYEEIFSNPQSFPTNNCFVMLPAPLQNAHRAMVAELKQRDNLQKVAASLSKAFSSITRKLTAPRRIKTACTPADALTHYNETIINYKEFSGRGCWSFLPLDVKNIICKHINTSICPIYSQYSKTNWCSPCTTTSSWFRGGCQKTNEEQSVEKKTGGTEFDNKQTVSILPFKF